MPYQVTCCFTVAEEVLEFYVDENDLTSSITPQDKLADPSVVKTITFNEPKDTAVIAIKSYEKNEIATASGQMRCVSTRPGSPWTFLMDDSFRGMKNDEQNGFPSKWKENSFVGGGAGVSYNPGDDLAAPACGAGLPGGFRVEVDQGYPLRPFFVLRKSITQPSVLEC